VLKITFSKFSAFKQKLEAFLTFYEFMICKKNKIGFTKYDVVNCCNIPDISTAHHPTERQIRLDRYGLGGGEVQFLDEGNGTATKRSIKNTKYMSLNVASLNIIVSKRKSFKS
jgi:hypothetical protein